MEKEIEIHTNVVEFGASRRTESNNINIKKTSDRNRVDLFQQNSSVVLPIGTEGKNR